MTRVVRSPEYDGTEAMPAVSERAREFELVRDTEARIMEAASGLFAKGEDK